MPSILKYFMKPKAEDYELPDTGDIASQLEEMVRLGESIPPEDAETESKAEPEEEPETIPAEEQDPVPTAAAAAEEDADEEQEEALAFAKAQAEALLQDARTRADAMIKQATESAEAEVFSIHQRAMTEGYSRGYEEGFAQGRQESAAKMQSEAQKLVDAVQQILARGSTLEEETMQRLQRELLEVSMTIAEKVIHVSLKSSEEVIKRMILAATQKMKRREWVQIYVANSDVKGTIQADPVLAAALNTISDHVKIVPMKEAEAGTCIVEMPDEIIDASASTQLDNIRAVIRESI